MAAQTTRLSSSVTVAQYLKVAADDDRAAAGKFIKERFDERYLSPVLDVDPKQRHGFSTMAVACRAIEALQAFRLVNGKLELAKRFTPPLQDDPYDPPPMRERDRMLPAAE